MIKMKAIEYYFETAPLQRPIFTEEIVNYVQKLSPGVQRAVVVTYINRYIKKHGEDVKLYRKGVYYKTVKTPFGLGTIDESDYIVQKFLKKGNEIIGYETGPSLLYKLNLTTQIPKLRYVATNAVKTNRYDYQRKIRIEKSDIEINSYNYRYLQFLDILDKKLVQLVEVDNLYELLQKFLIQNGLRLEKLMGYALKYKDSENLLLHIAKTVGEDI